MERPDLYVEEGNDKHLTGYSPTQTEHKQKTCTYAVLKQAPRPGRSLPLAWRQLGLAPVTPLRNKMDGWMDRYGVKVGTTFTF